MAVCISWCPRGDSIHTHTLHARGLAMGPHPPRQLKDAVRLSRADNLRDRSAALAEAVGIAATGRAPSGAAAGQPLTVRSHFPGETHRLARYGRRAARSARGEHGRWDSRVATATFRPACRGRGDRR
jgi:hypothetical protein